MPMNPPSNNSLPPPGDTLAPVQISETDGIRFLHLGGTAVQSAMRLSAPHQLELEYTRSMMGFLLFKRQAPNIALIGLGGGSLAKFIYRHLPASRLAAVEIHPEVITAARTWFDLPADDERLRVIAGDGVDFVRNHPDSQDVLLVDGYDAERVVDALVTPEFYRACYAMLRPGGVGVFNLWGSDPGYPLYFSHLAQAFGGHAMQLPSETKGNIIVFTFRTPFPDATFAYLSGRADRLQADIGLEFDDFLVRMGYCNQCNEDGFLA
jgi:spermidine synthase